MMIAKYWSVNGFTFVLCCYAVFLEVFELFLLTAGLPLHFALEPQSAFQSREFAATLECATEPRNADIQWYFNGSLLATDKQVVKEAGRSRLTLTLSQKTGYFYCVANSSEGAVRSLPALVSDAYLNKFSGNLVNRTIEAVAGNTVVIPCATPTGRPSTITEFEFNSTRLTPSARLMILPSGNLQISNARAEDSGLYHCIAVNPFTRESHSAPTVIDLKVTGSAKLIQPWFTWTPQSHLEVVQGQNLTLECAAEGWPVPQLGWKRYGGVLPQGRSSTIWGNLMISRVQKSDEGTYICRAEVNETHSQDLVAFIDVLEPPTVLLSSSDQNVTQFDSVTLDCHNTGSPKISVTWYHNAVPIVASQLVTISPNGSLTLRNVQLRHNGIYQCFAENSVGAASASTKLTIGAREMSEDLDPVLHDEMQNVAPNVDRVSPGPRSGGTRKLKKLPKSSSGQPRLTSVPDAVTDAALPPRGGIEEEVGAPATLLPPSKPGVTKTSDSSVLLNWTVTQNGSLPVVFFKVQYNEIVDSKRKNWKTLDEEIPPLSRSYEVKNLKSGSVYQFRIAAVYSNHDNKNGPISDRVAMKTGVSASGRSRAPVSSPMIVDVRPNISSFIVTWQYQPSERVSVDGFKIFYKPYGEDIDYKSIKILGADSRTATIADLKADTSYSIHMSCFNSDGESNSSLSAVRKTLGLLGSSVTSLYEKEFIEPADNERKATTMAVRAYHATNRNNTYASNELLFIVLGVVLSIMMLVLCIVMVMCAYKQRQQRRLMAALDGRRKFHDPSKTIYIGSHMKPSAEGSFLLNGVGTAPKKGTSNGYLSVRGNGVAPGSHQPASEYELNNSARPEEEISLRICPNSSQCDGYESARALHVLSPTDDRQTGYAATTDFLTEPAERAAAVYHPPEDLPTISRPKDVPFQQMSLKSRSSCDHRLHGNDSSESYPSMQTTASPDHIPRLHECQLLYRSPEHTRRSRDRTRGRHEQVSDRSLSASSQLSGSCLRSGRNSNQTGVETDPYVGGLSKISSILPVELHSSDADSHPEDAGGAAVGVSTEDSTVPITGRIPRSGGGSSGQSAIENEIVLDRSETIEQKPTSRNQIVSDSSTIQSQEND